ncbi:DUF551 domain-containing protein [Pseudomonas sp. zfem005]|uniref:DUF551 domain-containing protein n=1 Tax=Pseudomonas sp. zfem005 TaxID=3078200 RepID=UPI00292803B0|nr:DUF551 domain-containing protein [Pseudomonas sp. zfem005]MDU9415531.1 DUF551 domain-containing protein [Pseudomonas sp. zfem005]
MTGLSESAVQRRKDGWIKCSERMPEAGVTVDIWSRKHAQRLANYQLVRNYGGKQGNDFFEPVYSGYSCIRDASHWMPLPEEPED